jgi:formylglycine-generating enzyme required for sulfatase activity
MKTILSFVLLLACAISAHAITIETVPIGDVGNPNDAGNIAYPNTYGSVGYVYNIGKYEVTVAQYAAFLNAVAATDTYGLYNPNMGTELTVAGIARSGSSGSYSYSVIGSPSHPIAYISWGNAARFANWLNNGQPTGLQNASTTEGGAYTLNGAIYDAQLNAVSRNPSAKWFIPSANEWYKAAYYQPAAQGGDSDGYWKYPMKTNDVPYSDQPAGATPDNTRVGNFYQDDRVANGYDDGYAVSGSADLDFYRLNYPNYPNYLTDVGAYSSSPSFYGTFDQGGNVGEWTELMRVSPFRVLLGGGWSSYSAGSTSALGWYYQYPSFGSIASGFRVASLVPEPSTILLTIAAFATLLTVRRKPVSENRA